MSSPSYHCNGFAATHALGHMVLESARTYKQRNIYIELFSGCANWIA